MFSLSFTLVPAVVPDDPEKKPVEEAEDEQGKKKKTSVSELITPTPSILYDQTITRLHKRTIFRVFVCTLYVLVMLCLLHSHCSGSVTLPDKTFGQVHFS